MVEANCALSSRPIDIVLDSELDIKKVTDGADPMFCLPIVPLAKTKNPSIIDIF